MAARQNPKPTKMSYLAGRRYFGYFGLVFLLVLSVGRDLGFAVPPFSLDSPRKWRCGKTEITANRPKLHFEPSYLAGTRCFGYLFGVFFSRGPFQIHHVMSYDLFDFMSCRLISLQSYNFMSCLRPGTTTAGQNSAFRAGFGLRAGFWPDSMLCNSASGPDIGLPGRILAGLYVMQ